MMTVRKVGVLWLAMIFLVGAGCSGGSTTLVDAKAAMTPKDRALAKTVRDSARGASLMKWSRDVVDATADSGDVIVWVKASKANADATTEGVKTGRMLGYWDLADTMFGNYAAKGTVPAGLVSISVRSTDDGYEWAKLPK